MAAGLKTLELISAPNFFADLEQKVETLTNGILEAAKTANIPMSCNRIGGMFGLFFTEEEKVENFAQVTACDGERFNRFFHGMLKEGVYLAPSAFEAGFVSAAHSEEDLQATIDAAARVLASL